MDDGLLLLRVLLAVLLWGHAPQKLLSWFAGRGVAGTAPLFDQWGLRPPPAAHKPRGAYTATATSIVPSTRVAPTTVSAPAAMSAPPTSSRLPAKTTIARAGYELPLVYAVLAVGIGLTGPGRYSIDHATGLEESVSGNLLMLGCVVLAAVGAALFDARVRRARREQTAPLQTTGAGPQ